VLIEINTRTPEPRKIRQAVDALEKGEVIAYPTDATYALGCDLENRRAIDRLQQVKGLAKSQRLSFLCSDLRNVAKYAVMHDRVFRVLKAFLPGPYTFVLEATREVPRIVQSKRKTVGVRIPDSPVALAMVEGLGRPIITTTAARHGADPMVDPAEIDEEFLGLALVLDGGPGGTQPTSIVDLTSPMPQVLREGAGDVAAFLASVRP